MLDFLLKNAPEFLEKFREYSKESDIFCQEIDKYIEKEQIEMNPLSEIIETTYTTDIEYKNDNFETTFSDASNFILAKNKRLEEDNTQKAHIYIFNKVGRTKMNCHICEFKENSFPVDFIPNGLGVIEHFFCDQENSMIHELKFGTWELSTELYKEGLSPILNLFPAVLSKDEPSIEIKFIRDEKNTTIDFSYSQGKSQAENFYITFQINKSASDLLVSANIDHSELRKYARENIKEATQLFVYDCVSYWLSKSIDLEKLLDNADSKQIKVSYETPSTPIIIHPTLKELEIIERTNEHESEIRGRPNERIKTNLKSPKTLDWKCLSRRI